MNDNNKQNDKHEVLETSDFIRDIINQDLVSGKNDRRVATRFPPEPNGYLHIGHAKSINLNFGIARQYGGTCNLRFDDSNPCKEDQEYVDSIRQDVEWLGGDWQDREFYASDYFEQMYQFAEKLIEDDKAYVCELSADQITETRGTLSEGGKASPWRDRPTAQSLDLFRRMRAGEFPDGRYTLRAKIDMASPNFNMRDPVVYRIRHANHHRTGDRWCIYPMYDYCHCISDAMEGITHSICTLEFEDHRPLYDWFLAQLPVPCHPRQIEFARLNLTYTLMSKRRLLELVENKYVNSWSDPRLPTISGLRRRGYTPEGIQIFCERIGISKANSVVDMAFLEFCIREDLNRRALRRMAVLRPLRVVIENYPDRQIEELPADNNPEDPAAGTRILPFSKELYIEHDDFMECAPKNYFRLSPGREVRLKHAYIIKCEQVIKDSQGIVVELRCSYDPETRSGSAQEQRKVKGTIHWVSTAHAVNAEVHLYNQLFTKENPSDVEPGRDYKDNLNPRSLEVLKDCKLETNLRTAVIGQPYQFLRLGYFCLDAVDTQPDQLVFNRTVTLKDTWGKLQKKIK